MRFMRVLLFVYLCEIVELRRQHLFLRRVAFLCYRRLLCRFRCRSQRVFERVWCLTHHQRVVEVGQKGWPERSILSTHGIGEFGYAGTSTIF